MNEIQTARPNHAIEIMAIGLDFSHAIDNQLLGKLVSLYDDDPVLQAHLPKKQNVRALSVNIRVDEQDISTDDASESIGGCDFYSTDDNGNISWSVSVRQNFIACNCRAYDRWDEVKAVTLQLLTPFIQVLQSENIEISSIGLQYLDVLHISEASFPSFNTAIFSQGSKHLAKSIFENEGVWHAHNGWFEIEDGQKRFLNSFDLDVVEVEGHEKCQVRLNGHHKYIATSSTELYANITKTLDALHEKNKKLLCDVLSRNVLDMINLVCE